MCPRLLTILTSYGSLTSIQRRLRSSNVLPMPETQPKGLQRMQSKVHLMLKALTSWLVSRPIVLSLPQIEQSLQPARLLRSTAALWWKEVQTIAYLLAGRYQGTAQLGTPLPTTLDCLLRQQRVAESL